MARDYFVFDLETGGFDPNKNAILSIGAVVLDGETLEEKVRYYTLVQDEPEREISEDALKVNGLDLADIKENGSPIEDVLNTMRVLMAGKIIVAQNAAFDASFLNERGFDIQNAVDTMIISRRKWPGASAKLGDICARIGVKVENAHNAIADAAMTGMVLKEFKTKFPDSVKEEKIYFRR